MAKHGAAASSMFGIVAVLVLADIIPTAVESIGVCYGTLGGNLPQPSEVVQMYKSNSLTGMRIYSPNRTILDALAGSGIPLVMDIGGVEELSNLAASLSNAKSWVQSNVMPHKDKVNFKYIAVGNEVEDAAAQNILPAMKNVHDALVSAGLSSSIMVSTSVKFNTFTDTFPPSNGKFRNPTVMVPIAQFLASNSLPLLVNVYTYFAYKEDPRNIKLSYATFQPDASMVPVMDNGLIYTNLFDAMVDSVYAALEKAGTPGVRVVVSESGWPAAGGLDTTPENARRHNQGLIDHVGKGTPKKPGALETYIFAMFNENQKKGDPVEQHFGLFNPDKSPAYTIRF